MTNPFSISDKDAGEIDAMLARAKEVIGETSDMLNSPGSRSIMLFLALVTSLLEEQKINADGRGVKASEGALVASVVDNIITTVPLVTVAASLARSRGVL